MSVDLEALVPVRTEAETRQLCIEAGREGGRLGGHPRKPEILSIEEQIVQAQLDVEGKRDDRLVKAVQRDDTFGFSAKAAFCEMYRKARKVVEDEGLDEPPRQEARKE